jgi:hypothetical protein
MAENQMFEVVRPIAEAEKTLVNAAARLPDLRGKTIGELSSNIYNAHISFPIIREMLKERYPDIKIIPYTEINESLPQSTIVTYSGDTAAQEEKERAIIKIAREKGCEAFIIGNGG